MLAKRKIEVEESIILKIVDRLRYTPTGDNSQHWSFEWDGEILKVIHDINRARHPLNDGNYGSMLSLGCLVEILEISSQELGYIPNTQYRFEDFQHQPVLLVNFEECSPQKSALSEWVEKRHTNRSHYGDEELPNDFFDSLQQEFIHEKVVIKKIEKPSKDFINYLIKTDQYFMENRNVFLNIGKWIRFNDTETTKTRDGLRLANIGLSKLDGYFIKLFLKSPLLHKTIYNLHLKFKNIQNSKDTYQNTKYFISFSIKEETPEAIVNAGRAMYRSWLMLNRHGFGVQPLTSSAQLPFVLRAKDRLLGCLNKSFFKHFRNGHRIMKEEFDIKDATPIWMLRTGKAEPIAESNKTLRLKTEQILKI